MYKVIIVDDERWSLIDFTKSITWEEYGFEVIKTFTSPTKALEEFEALDPDVIFTDIKMPKINGIKLIESVKSISNKPEFVIISAHSDFESARQAIKMGVTEYCLKPINPSDLGSLLKGLRRKLDSSTDKELTFHLSQNDMDEESKSNFEELLRYLETHYSEKIMLIDMAEQFYMNKNYICHLFQKNLNTTFSSYLAKVRINAAKHLLRNTKEPIKNIAIRIGFTDVFYFSKVFKKYESVSPGQYRTMVKKGQVNKG
ncbi:response regulator [Vallitalea pronyensis]|uniref:Stage 0 sporulation protein A homolog n=1 Tax=Vallitalea pronyensis TaxID=1348613 RepID=A0A8J8MN29_9FIRM|nr:response regulator [Vallitalea pronyensis]QUI24800.1 response regulator [Vallitalea pronyensis]